MGGMGIRLNGWPQASEKERELTIVPNMVFAYACANSVLGYGGAKIENTYAVTDTGCEALTVWPFDEIPILGLLSYA